MGKVGRRPSEQKTCELELGGAYTTPDGTTLVVGAGRGGHYFLYRASTWEEKTWVINLPIAYEVDAAGRLLDRAGNATGWRADDLTYMRRDAR